MVMAIVMAVATVRVIVMAITKITMTMTMTMTKTTTDARHGKKRKYQWYSQLHITCNDTYGYMTCHDLV